MIEGDQEIGILSPEMLKLCREPESALVNVTGRNDFMNEDTDNKVSFVTQDSQKIDKDTVR